MEGTLVILKKFQVGNYMFKVNNRNTRTRFKICSKLTIETTERRLFLIENECETPIGCLTLCSIKNWHRYGVFIVNFEHISYLVVVFY